MPNVFYREPSHAYPIGLRGDGVYLYDADGRRYLDGSGGAAVSTLGHGNKRVVERIKQQLDALDFAHTAFFTNEPQELLAARVAERFGTGAVRVYFVSGGSEANETAIKLARQYWQACGANDKTIFISREQSYHGNTLGALSLSGNPGRRKLYAPLLHDWPRISPCYAYRHKRADETDHDYALRCADELEQTIVNIGAERVAGFVAETVVGATLGAAPAAPGYFQAVREICDRHDILLILDEVMCGSGRTGTFFAFEQESIVPDLVTLAKGLGAGYQPLGATVCRENIHDRIVAAHGEFAHGHTYVGHPVACAAGVAVQQVIDEDHLLANVVARGHEMIERLHSAFDQHPHVGDVRGRGLFAGVEIVRDKETREPVDASLRMAAWLRQRAMDEGLICYPFGGTADGTHGAHVLLAPPFTFTSGHIDEMVEKLVAVLADVDISGRNGGVDD